MQNYWWVNHKKTVRQEVEGQYLWSPKTNANGRRNQSYENMREASPGDLVLSYAFGSVGWVGRVTEFAITAPKPEEFRNAGAYWDHEGWLLPVYWTPLTPPVRPKAMIGTLGPLLPKKHAPIAPDTGNGNQNVYLANIGPEAFQEIIASAALDQEALQRGGGNRLTFDVVTEQLNDVAQRWIESDAGLDSTEKETLVRARRGQGVFRKNVEAREVACRLTGITNPALLIASHIKPWRICKTAKERLDGANGLLLTPDADHLFDRGFISFSEGGEVIVSPRVPPDDLRRLGFDQAMQQRGGMAEAPAIWNAGSFDASQAGYLGYHRQQVFIA
jgi:hypothetical protein